MPITIDAVRERTAALYDSGPKPDAGELQRILDDIEAVPCEKKRLGLFISAMQFLNSDLKILVHASRIRAERRWNVAE